MLAHLADKEAQVERLHTLAVERRLGCPTALTHEKRHSVEGIASPKMTPYGCAVRRRLASKRI
jgi:hypothetical protein